jgi:hypothetical protein
LEQLCYRTANRHAMRRYRLEDTLSSSGTLDNPAAVTPDVHIFTRTKLPWLKLPEGVPAFKSIYQIDRVWPDESKERLGLNRAK